MHHAQSVGTHNSYHLDSWDGAIAPWAYNHAPLNEQLEDQGVRQFELDVYWRRNVDTPEARFEVFHVPIVDPTSTCDTLRQCLTAQRAGSDARPGHQPFVTLLEIKTGAEDDEQARRLIAELEEELAAVWPRERLVTPATVQGDHPDLRTAVEEGGGWPTLGRVRGRAVYVLHTGGRLRQALVERGADALMIPDAGGDGDAPWAAFHAVNDPVASADRIADLVRRGHLVRTRADVDGEQAAVNDTSRRDAALASGAHFISTDFPVPHPDTGYVVRMPRGTPSRCNPVTAPDECTSERLETPPGGL